MKEKVLKWLLNNKSVLKLSAIEKAIGAPDSTLQKVAQGKMQLTDHWSDKLIEWRKDFLRME